MDKSVYQSWCWLLINTCSRKCNIELCSVIHNNTFIKRMVHIILNLLVKLHSAGPGSVTSCKCWLHILHYINTRLHKCLLFMSYCASRFVWNIKTVTHEPCSNTLLFFYSLSIHWSEVSWQTNPRICVCHQWETSAEHTEKQQQEQSSVLQQGQISPL